MSDKGESREHEDIGYVKWNGEWEEEEKGQKHGQLEGGEVKEAMLPLCLNAPKS